MKRLIATLSSALLLLSAMAYAQDATVTLNNGDANNDSSVNLFDYTVIDIAYGSIPSSGNWNPDADLNGDRQVNSADYTVADSHYGQISATTLTGTTGTSGGQNYVTVRLTLSDWVGTQEIPGKTVDFRLRKQGTTTVYNYSVTVISGSDIVLALPSSGTYDGTAISSHFLRAAFTATSHADTTPPNPGTATCSARQLINDISVGYSGASDTQSGLKKVELWAKKGAGNWENTSIYSSSASGQFAYPASSFVGTIYFDLVAEDNCGNRSSAASGIGDCSILYGSAGTCTFLQAVMPQ